MKHPISKSGITGLILLVLLWLILTGSAQAGLRVITTTQDLASLARELGGDAVDVESLTFGNQDPHMTAPKPSYMFKLKHADLLIYNGMDLEAGWLPLVLQGTQNPEILLGRPGHLNASIGIQPLEVPHERSQSLADTHPFGNPHYLLDPANGLKVSQTIADRLIQLIPDAAPDIQKSFQRLSAILRKKIAAWDQRMARFNGMRVISYHRTWSFFFKRYGIQYGGTLEPLPGIAPTPRHLTELVDIAGRHQAGAIVQANFYESRSAEWMARKSGLPVLILPVSVGGVEGVTDYPGLIDYLVRAFESKVTK